MLTGFLVVNKETGVQEFLVRRSIMDVKMEKRSLTELDLQHLEIIDVDKLLYIYYASEDSEIPFRSDLNVLRQLLESPFFHADEIIFLLVEAKQANIDDLIKAATRNANGKSQIRIIHHTGSLTLSDVSQYLVGSVFGAVTHTLYKDVFIREANNDERERFDSNGGDIKEIIPALTDMYSAYRQKASVESGTVVTSNAERPQEVMNFSTVEKPEQKIFNTYIFSTVPFAGGEKLVKNLLQYFETTGERAFIVDLRSSKTSSLGFKEYKDLPLVKLSQSVIFAEPCALCSTRLEKFGAVVECLDNLQGVADLILVTDDIYKLDNLKDFVVPFSSQIVTVQATHFNKNCIDNYIRNGVRTTSLFLNRNVMFEDLDIQMYKEGLKGVSVFIEPDGGFDPIDFYNCITGRWKE